MLDNERSELSSSRSATTLHVICVVASRATRCYHPSRLLVAFGSYGVDKWYIYVSTLCAYITRRPPGFVVTTDNHSHVEWLRAYMHQ